MITTNDKTIKANAAEIGLPPKTSAGPGTNTTGQSGDMKDINLGTRGYASGECWRYIWDAVHIAAPDLGSFPSAQVVASAMAETASRTGCGRHEVRLVMVATSAIIHFEPAADYFCQWNVLAAFLGGCRLSKVGGQTVNTERDGYCWRVLCTDPDRVASIGPWPCAWLVATWAVALPPELKSTGTFQVIDVAGSVHIQPGGAFDAGFDQVIAALFWRGFKQVGGRRRAPKGGASNSDDPVLERIIGGPARAVHDVMDHVDARMRSWIPPPPPEGVILEPFRCNCRPDCMEFWEYVVKGKKATEEALCRMVHSPHEEFRHEAELRLADRGPRTKLERFLLQLPIVALFDGEYRGSTATFMREEPPVESVPIAVELHPIIKEEKAAACLPLCGGDQEKLVRRLVIYRRMRKVLTFFGAFIIIAGFGLLYHYRWYVKEVVEQIVEPVRLSFEESVLEFQRTVLRELRDIKYRLDRGLGLMLQEGLDFLTRALLTGALIMVGNMELMHANADLGHNAIWTYGVFGLVLVYVAFWVTCYVVGPGLTTTLRFKFVPFGSTGDMVPLKYYHNLMEHYGFDVEWAPTNDKAEGEMMLEEIEKGDVFKTSGYLSRFLSKIQEFRVDEQCYVIAPLGMLTDGPRTVTYDLTPPAHVISSYTLGIRTPILRWFNTVTSFAFLSNKPTLRIGSFPGYAPRSCDSFTLLKQVEKKGRRPRRNLVCMGSSSAPEPTGLDPAWTWSTRKDSIYRHEPRIDHKVAFLDYENVYCHGGAGTMATAAACGCRAYSCTQILDRNYVDDSQFDFNTSVDIFWVAVINRLNWVDTMKFFRHLQVTGGYRRLLTGFGWWAKAFWSSFFSRFIQLVFLCLQFQLFLRSLSFQPTLEQVIHQFLVPKGLNPWVGYAIATHLSSSLVLAVRRSYQKYYIPEMLPLAVYSLPEGLSDPGFWFCMNVWGFLPAIFFYSYAKRAMNSLSFRLRWLVTAGVAWWEHSQRKDDRYLTLRLSKITGYLFALVPAYHVELVDPVTGVCIGTDNNDGQLKVYNEIRTRRRISWEMKTQIPRGNLGLIHEKLARFDGQVYNFRNTCQTSLMVAISQNEGENSMLMLMMHALILCTTTMFFGCGYIAFFLLSLTATFSGQAVMKSTTLVNLMYSAGAEDGRDGLGIAEVWAYLFGGSSPATTTGRIYQDMKNTGDHWGVLAREASAILDIEKISEKPRPGPGFSRYKVGDREVTVKGHDNYVHRSTEMEGRDGKQFHFMHAISWAMRTDIYGTLDASAAFKELWTNTTKACQAIVDGMQKGQRIAFMAFSPNLEKDDGYWEEVVKMFDKVVCFTNEPMDLPAIVLTVPVLPRMLACFRLIPYWLETNLNCYCINGRADPRTVGLVKDVIQLAEGELIAGRTIASTCWNSTHSLLAAAYLNTTDKEKNEHILGVIEKWGHCYGTDEAVLVHKANFVQHYFNSGLLNSLSAETNFPVRTTIVRLVTNRGEVISQGEVTNWSWGDLDGIYQKGISCQPLHGSPKAEWELDDEGFPALKVLGRVYSTAQWFKDAGELTKDTPGAIKDLVLQARRNVAMFQRRLTELRERMAGTKIMKCGVDVTNSIASAIDILGEVFQDPAGRAKKVWAPLTRFTIAQQQLNKLQLRLNQDPKFKVMNYDETLSQYIRHLNFNRGLNNRTGKPVEPLGFHDYTRAIRRNPLVDTYMTERAKYYHDNWQFPQGIDGMTRATKDIMVGSLSRYTEIDAGYTIEGSEAQRIAEAIIDHNPELYLDAELSDPRRILNSMVQKYSPSIPFIGTTSKGIVRFRKRRDLRSEHWDTAIVKTVRHWLDTGVWLPMLYHAFPKSQVVQKEKLDVNPFKLRSITGQNLLSYVQSMVFCMDVNKRRHWFTAPGQVGAPLNGAAMNFTFGKIARCKHKISLDVTAMDANENAGVFEVIKLIRQKGFENHPQAETIGKHLDCMYEAIKKGFIVNLVDQVAVVEKTRGGATGHSNVSTDNTIALQVIMMHALWKTHNIHPARFFRDCVLVNQSDDNMFGTDLALDWPKVFEYLDRHHHIQCRVEGEGNIYGQTFLGKRVEAGARYKDDFDMIGIDPPEFAVIHDHKNMLMRYLDFKVEKTHRFRNPVQKALYMIERIQGDILLTAHQRKLYRSFAQDYDHYVRTLPKNMRESPRFQKVYSIPSYQRVVQLWYKDFDPLVLDVFQRLRYSFLWLDLASYHLGVVAKNIEDWTEKLPTKLLALDDPELFNAPRYTSGHFEVEKFLYYSAYKTNGVPPDVPTMDYLARQSPFSSFVDVSSFMNSPIAEVEVSQLEVERRFHTAQNRMIILGALYIQVNRLLEVMKLLPGGTIVSILFTLYSYTVPRLYAMGNFVNWLHKGQSSPELSAMVPRDLYYNHKYIALRILESAPVTAEKIMVVDKLLGGVTWSMIKVTQLWQPTLGQSTEQQVSVGKTDTRLDWDEAVADVLETMHREQSCVSISAPTGTGKSYWMPRSLLGRELNGQTIRQVMLLMPRKILCAELGLPNVHWLKKGQPYIEERTFVTATYGHFYERIRNGFDLPPGVLVIMDEAHEESPEMVGVMRMLLPAGRSILATATPVFQHVPLIPHLQLTIARQYVVEEVELLGHNPVEAYIWATRERKEKLNRILWIEPSLKACEKIADSLAQVGVAATIVHSKARNIPEHGHIIATQIVDAGINIKGITCVIDSGTSIVNHKGWVGKLISPAYVRDQRRGRTGRFCDGLYISLQKPGAYKPEPYPSVSSTLEDPALAQSLGATVRFQVIYRKDRLLLNRFAAIDKVFRHAEEKKMVSLWHYLRNDMNEQAFIKTWRGLEKNVIPESCEYVMERMEITTVAPYAQVRKLAETYPVIYETTDGENITRPVWGRSGLANVVHPGCPLPEQQVKAVQAKKVILL